MKLPKYEEAAIPEMKFNQYALNPDRNADKAYVFKAALRYEAKMRLTGFNGKTADVLTTWSDDRNQKK